MKLHTFLNYGGNCEQALRFYEEHLGGKITMMMRRGEQPHQPVTWPGWEDSVQYAIIDLGQTQLMASDVPPDRFQPMRSVYLTLTVDSAGEAERFTSSARASPIASPAPPVVSFSSRHASPAATRCSSRTASRTP